MSDKIKFLDQLVFVKNTPTTTKRVFFDINSSGDLEIRGPGVRDNTTTTATGGLRVYSTSTFLGSLHADGGIVTPPGVTSEFSSITVGSPTDPTTTEVALIQGSLRITGDVAIAGTIVNTSQEDLLVTDNKIVLNSGETGDGITTGTAGILIDRGTLATVAIQFIEGTLAWDLNAPAKKSDAGAATLLPANPRIINVADPVNAQDVATKHYIQTAISLDTLNDVVITAPAAKQYVRHNGTNWTNSSSYFTDLADVSVGLAAGYLRWDTTSSTMKYDALVPWASLSNVSAVSKLGQGSLKFLTDVDSSLSSVTAGTVLRNDGTKWTHAVLAYTDLSGTPTNNTYTFVGLSDTNDTKVNNGFLRWNGTATTINYQATIPASDITGLAAVATGGALSTLDNIVDVTLTAPAAGHLLSHNGTVWVNVPPPSTSRIQDAANVTYVDVDDVANTVTVKANTGGNIVLNTADGKVIISNVASTESQITSPNGINIGVNSTTTPTVKIQGLQYPNTDGTDGQVLKTNGAAVLSWYTPPVPTYTFLALTDTPSSYTSQAGKLVSVNTAGTGLEFIAPPSPNSSLTGSLVPATTNSISLGSAANYWANGYVTNLSTQSILPVNSNTGVGSGAISNIGSTTAPYDKIYAASIQGYSADLAERYEADAIYPIGTVVKIGGDKEITIADKYLDKDTFGVICDNPAYGMNSWAGTQDTHPFVTMVGRVPVLIHGPAKKGQRIITGTIPGTAIAVDYDKGWHNSIVGRVLQDKASTDVGLTLCVVQVKI
jgi:hypothetical protein